MQIGTLELWTNPLWGYQDGVYNVPEAQTVLGTAQLSVSNVIVPNGETFTELKIDLPANNRPNQFTYARFSVNNVCYFVQSSTVVNNRLLVLNLMLDPITTYNVTTVNGICTRRHFGAGTGSFHDFPLNYDIEPWLWNYNTIAATTHGEVRDIFISDVALATAPVTANALTQFTNTSLDSRALTALNLQITHGLGFIPQVNFLAMPHIRGGDSRVTIRDGFYYFATHDVVRRGINQLTMLGIQPNVRHYQIPEVLLSGTHSLNSTSFTLPASLTPTRTLNSANALSVISTHDIVNPYTGTEIPIRGFAQLFLTHNSNGSNLVFTPIDFAGSNAQCQIRRSAVITPDGFPTLDISGFARGMPQGGGSRLTGNTWASAGISTNSQIGLVLAQHQIRQARYESTAMFDQQNELARLEGRQQGINNTRQIFNMGLGLLNTVKSFANNPISGLFGAATLAGWQASQGEITNIGNAIRGGVSDISGLSQIDLNADMLANQQEWARIQYRMRNNAIQIKESQVSSPQAISLQASGIVANFGGSNEFTNIHATPIPAFNNWLERHLRAYGYKVREFVTTLNNPRTQHNFWLFETADCTIPAAQNSNMAKILADSMFMTGVRRWRTQPTQANVTNNT